MIQYYYDKEINIQYINLSGRITKEDIIASIGKITKLWHTKGLKLLYDLSEAELLFTIQELREISETSVSTENILPASKTALIVTNPKQTALAMLYSQFDHGEFSQRKVFSTYEAAVNWLKN